MSDLISLPSFTGQSRAQFEMRFSKGERLKVLGDFDHRDFLLELGFEGEVPPKWRGDMEELTQKAIGEHYAKLMDLELSSSCSELSPVLFTFKAFLRSFSEGTPVVWNNTWDTPLFCRCLKVSEQSLMDYLKDNPGPSHNDLKLGLNIGLGCGSCLETLDSFLLFQSKQSLEKSNDFKTQEKTKNREEVFQKKNQESLELVKKKITHQLSLISERSMGEARLKDILGENALIETNSQWKSDQNFEKNQKIVMMLCQEFSLSCLFTSSDDSGAK